ncbi:MAG: amidohydrolase [Chloroflexota bacterium]|nr:MAG: amidohydrolase [Chloroflexota bacterium]
MPIIDAHAHVARVMTGFRQPLRFGRAIDGGREHQFFPPSFDPTASSPEVLLGYMDQVGVDRTMLVQHHLYGDQNAVVLASIRQWRDRFSGFAYLGGMGQASAPDDLERLIDLGMLGLKVELPSTRRLRPEFAWDGPAEMRIWERLARLGRPLWIDINGCGADDVAALDRALSAVGSVRLTVCHVGGAPEGIWRERAMMAKKFDGWVDLAALPLLTGADEEYPYAKAQDLVRWAVEQFGAERVLWGSDYPPTLNSSTYRQLLDMVRRHCDFLTPAQKELVLGGAAEAVVREFSA